MLPIICKGKGLIPRVGIIAPVLTPFKVNLQTLTIIVRTPGSILRPYFVDPVTLEETALDNINYKKIYDSYQNQSNVVEEIKTKLDKIDEINISDMTDKGINSIMTITKIDQISEDEQITKDTESIIVIENIITEDDIKEVDDIIPIGTISTEDYINIEELVDTDCVIPIITKDDIDKDDYIPSEPVDASKVDENSANFSTSKVYTSPINDPSNTFPISNNKYTSYSKNKHHKNKK